MDKVLHPYRANLAIGEESCQGQRALEALYGFGIVVGFAIEVTATAATTYK